MDPANNDKREAVRLCIIGLLAIYDCDTRETRMKAAAEIMAMLDRHVQYLDGVEVDK
jgi:hypothetical protein